MKIIIFSKIVIEYAIIFCYNRSKYKKERGFMKKLKKALGLLLAFVIIFSTSTNTFANSFPTTKQIQVDNHSFEIKERTGKNHEIIRTYENNENIITRCAS